MLNILKSYLTADPRLLIISFELQKFQLGL